MHAQREIYTYASKEASKLDSTMDHHDHIDIGHQIKSSYNNYDHVCDHARAEKTSFSEAKRVPDISSALDFAHIHIISHYITRYLIN